MSLAWHENVRLQVSVALLNILKEIVKQRLKVSPSLELSLLESFLNRGSPEHLIMLMPQEVYVGGERRRMDAVFGGVIAFDYKSREGEFEEAVRDAREKYLPHLPKVKYFIVTNYDSWRIYRVSREAGIRLTEVYSGGKDMAVNVLRQLIAREVEVLRVPPYPALIESLYTMDAEESVRDLKAVLGEVKEHDKVKPLFEAYKKIMELLYSEGGQASEGFYVDLFVRHAVMQMMVMASLAAALDIVGDPVDVCSGSLLTADERSLDIALPYLNWWKIVYRELREDLRSKVRKAAETIASRARLVDWELGGSEDVFRRLYEFLVEPETRRRIGEYYTPLWIVDMIIKEFELKDRLVMDPFCGSGTFLVRAFYKKVLEEGEDPDEAYEELVGLDVNPLAVAVARAELVIAYRRVTGRLPATPPRVYHIDTLAMWFGGRELPMRDPEYLGIVDIIAKYMGRQHVAYRAELTKIEPQQVLASLSRVEQLMTIGTKLSLLGDNFEGSLKSYLLSRLRDDDLVERAFKEVVTKTTFIPKLAKLVKKYGNSVWAITIISAVVPSIAGELRPHIIVTNPPWVQMTKYRASYAEKMRELAIEVLKNGLKVDSKKAASMVTGSDIACAALYKALKIAKEGVGFVMYREQSFYSKTSMRSGIALTYAILKGLCREGCEVKLIDIDCDAFGHGDYPALVVVKKKN